MEQAALMAVQYDYDGAIELLKSQPDYESNTDMQSAVSDYENTKATCTEYPLEQITHVFFHFCPPADRSVRSAAHSSGNCRSDRNISFRSHVLLRMGIAK